MNTKKTITILLTLGLLAIGFGQNVNIPDANFKAYLVGNPAINTNNDSEISVEEANNVTSLYIMNKSINDLSGIQRFNKLIDLDCSFNTLKTLDVSNLSNLKELRCYNNQLTKLDVSKNPQLVELNCLNNEIFTLNVNGLQNMTLLYCNNNHLTNLEVSSLKELIFLNCSSNKLITLDISKLSSLTGLHCNSNLLNYLDLSTNIPLKKVYSNDNKDLKLICISSIQNTSNWQKDASAKWSTNCEPLAFSKTQSTEKPQVLKAYNLQGQEVPLNTKGEVIILLYDNGLREKTYVAE